MKLKILLLISISVLFGCNEKVKSNRSTDHETRANELIAKILTDKNDEYVDLDCKCISEKPNLILNRTSSLKDFVMKTLNIKDTLHLANQLRLYKDFKISNAILPKWNIITENKFDLYKISSSDNSMWESLLIDCPKGFYSITKPIFNETFDRAIVGFGITCGRLCGGGVTRIYKYVNGEWIMEKEISSWVS